MFDWEKIMDDTNEKWKDGQHKNPFFLLFNKLLDNFLSQIQIIRRQNYPFYLKYKQSI